MQITLFDVIILIVVAFGVWEGRKKGFYKMITPFISFIISIILMKWVSMFIMNIFGNSLIETFSGYLDTVILQMQLTDNAMINDLKYDFVQKFVQGGVFIVSYAVINVVVTILLDKVRRISNNMVLYRIDQILGCVFGALSNMFTVVLILTILQVLCDMQIIEVVNIVEYMRKSAILDWLLDNNYVYKLFLSL